MSFTDAVSSVLKNATNFPGRARRSEYWYFFLAVILAEIVIGIVYAVSDTLGIVLYVVLVLAIIVPTLALSIRRLHDTDRTGWWLLIGLVPFGGLVLLVFYVLDGTPGPNKYGPSPKAMV
ncbi:MAG: DUF805 domain-containing protein [Nocardioides sp.]|nr:DUF805 domain-containing protein [Nocardioides sp.]